MFDGTFKIRNRHSGKYLAVGKAGKIVGTSLMHWSSTGRTDWKLSRNKKSPTPQYHLRSSETNDFLAVKDGQIVLDDKFDSLWTLSLSDEGVFHSLTCVGAGLEQLRLTDHRGALSLQTVEDASLAAMSSWDFESQLSWLRIPQANEDGYKSQFEEMSNIAVWPGTDLTWAHLCESADLNCDEVYAGLREKYKRGGVLAETHRRVVTELMYTSSCQADLNWAMGVITFLPASIKAMKLSAGAECDGQSLASMSEHMRAAISDECFSACALSMEVYFSAHPPVCGVPTDAKAFFDGILKNSACSGLPPATLEHLTEFSVQKLCWKFQVPNHLWIPDQGSRDLSLATADGHPVCSVHEGKMKQEGTCPSGTTCQCPKQWISDHARLEQMQTKARFFVPEGASVASVFTCWEDEVEEGILENLLISGLSFTAAVSTAALSAPPLVLYGAGKVIYNAVTWSCKSSVACWPAWPEKTTENKKGVCRIPKSAKKGGSQVWFMPPPGMTVHYRVWYRSFFRRCEYKSCGKEDAMQQKIGFGRPSKQGAVLEKGGANIYNCQPLVYEQMNTDLQLEFRTIIKRTIPSQYEAEM